MTTRTARILRTCLFAGTAIAAIGTSPLHAQTAPQASILDEITVTGSRTSAEVGNIASSISIVSERELVDQLNMATDIDQVLSRLIPGLAIGSASLLSPTGTGNGPSLRGRSATVLINGVPVNTLLRGNGIDTQLVDPNAISRVEVKRGASASFGFGAPGGIIQLLTRKGETEELSIRARAGYEFSSKDVQESGHFQAYVGAGAAHSSGFDYYLGFGYKDTGPSLGPDGEIGSNDAFKSYNFDANIGYAFNDESELRFSGSFLRRNTTQRYVYAGDLSYASDDSYSEYIVPEGIRSDTYYAAPDSTSKKAYQSAYVASLTYKHANVLGSSFELLAFIQQNTLRSPIFGSNFETLEFTQFGTFDQKQDNSRLGLRSTMVTDFSLREKDDLRLIYGADWVQDQMSRPYTAPSSTQTELVNVPGFGQVPSGLPTDIIFPLSPPVELQGFALFAQAEFRIDRLLLTGGIRHEMSSPSSLGYNEGGIVVEAGGLKDFSKTLFNAGFVFDINSRFQIFGGFSQGVEISELGRVARDVARAAIRVDGVANIEDLQTIRLNPSVTTEFEIGARGTIGTLELTAAAFYSRAPSAARVAPPPGPLTQVLVPVREPTRIWGLELTADYAINDQFRIGAVATYQDGKVKVDEDAPYTQLPYDRITPPRITAYVNWKPTADLELNVQGTQVFNVSPFAPSVFVPFGNGTGAANIDGYFLLDAFATLAMGPGKLAFGISNIFNEEYLSVDTQASADSLDLVPEPGRRFRLVYSFNF